MYTYFLNCLYSIVYKKNRRNIVGSNIVFLVRLGTNTFNNVYVFWRNKSISIVKLGWEIGIGWNFYMVDLVDINVNANSIVEYLEIYSNSTKNFYNLVVIDCILVICCIFSIGYLVILYKF